MKTFGCLLGSRMKQVLSELHGSSVTVITTFNSGFKICMCEIGYFALYSHVCNSFSENISTYCTC